MNDTNGNKGGIGFSGLLTIVFITLKLCNIIEWSWVWVLSPAWIYLIMFVLIVTLITIIRLR